MLFVSNIEESYFQKECETTSVRSSLFLLNLRNCPNQYTKKAKAIKIKIQLTKLAIHQFSSSKLRI